MDEHTCKTNTRSNTDDADNMHNVQRKDKLMTWTKPKTREEYQCKQAWTRPQMWTSSSACLTKERKTYDEADGQTCMPCKQAWLLFESSDDEYLFIRFRSCTVRAKASTAAARSACAPSSATCDAQHVPICIRFPLALPLLIRWLTMLFSCAGLAPRPRSLFAILGYVLLAGSLCCCS